MVGVVEDRDDLEAAIDRALRRAALPASGEAHSGVPLHAAYAQQGN